MITRCFSGPDLFGLSDTGFMVDVTFLLTIALPAAFCYALWRKFVTEKFNPRGNIVALGLDNSTATQTELYGRRLLRWQLILYGFTSFLTFSLGVFVFESHVYLQEWLYHNEFQICR